MQVDSLKHTLACDKDPIYYRLASGIPEDVISWWGEKQ
jgi:hypothetical protein